MERYERKLTGVVLDGPIQWLGLDLSPESDGILACAQGMTQKEFDRTVALLKGYTAKAAAKKAGKALTAEDLPAQEGEDALFWVWFDRFQRETDPSKRLMAGYNAFGALQGGFAQAQAAMERCLGRQLAEKLQEHIRTVRREEGDLAEKAQPYEKPASWSAEEWEALKQGLLMAGRTR